MFTHLRATPALETPNRRYVCTDLRQSLFFLGPELACEFFIIDFDSDRRLLNLLLFIYMPEYGIHIRYQRMGWWVARSCALCVSTLDWLLCNVFPFNLFLFHHFHWPTYFFCCASPLFQFDFNTCPFCRRPAIALFLVFINEAQWFSEWKRHDTCYEPRALEHWFCFDFYIFLLLFLSLPRLFQFHCWNWRDWWSNLPEPVAFLRSISMQ